MNSYKKRHHYEIKVMMSDLNFKIKNLKEKMKKAIAIENYEIAQVLKLKIKELEEEKLFL